MLTRRRLFSLALLLACLPCLTASADESLNSLREQLVIDAEDGRLDDFTLLEGSLIASGVSERSSLTRYLTVYQHHEFEALAEAIDLAPEQRSAQLFDYLHERMLTGEYIADRTELDLTLADGNYNCVTATVLYCELCRAARIDSQAVAAPGHVFGQITLAKQTHPIETTCGGWFSLLDDDQRSEALAQRRGKQGGEERTLSDIELIAKIFYNRGVFLLERDRHAEAIALIRLSLRLDPFDIAAKANLLAAFNNWALAECENRNWEEAIRLIQTGLQIDPHYEALLANELHAHHGLAMSLCGEGRYAEAAALLEAGYARRPEAPLFSDGRFAIYRSWTESLLRQGRRAEATRVISHVQQIDSRRAMQIRESLGA